ncbi:hypothetical protein D9M71_236960 [compost metagenome]
MWQQLVGQGRGADDAQRRREVLPEAVGQTLHRFERVVDPGDFHLQLLRFAGGLQSSADAGEQHEPQLILGVAQQALDFGHWQLQPFGGGAQVTGLQERLDHFDMA